MKTPKVLRILASPSLVFSLLACSAQPNITVQEVETTEIVVETSSAEEFLATQKPLSAPIRIVLIKDYSLSGKKYRIAAISLDEIHPLLDLLEHNGGEIALIGLCDDSDRPALRVYIKPPPYLSPSALQQANKPTPPDTRGVSPFKLKELNEDYESKLARYQQLQQENEAIIQQHQGALAQWQEETEQKLEAFGKEIAPLLEKPASCLSTDVWGGVRRADRFLSEDDGSWKQSPKNFALFVTDGLHTTATAPVQMHSNAEILLVNGSGESGVFANFQHRSFEAVSAAVRYLVEASSSQEATTHE